MNTLLILGVLVMNHSAAWLTWIDQAIKSPVWWVALVATDASGTETTTWAGTEGRMRDESEKETGYVPGTVQMTPALTVGAPLPFSNFPVPGMQGSEIILLNASGEYDVLSALNWRDQVQTVYLYDRSEVIEDAEAVLTLTADSIRETEEQLSIVTSDPSVSWNRLVSTERFDGEDNEEVNGTLKPFVAGRVHYAAAPRTGDPDFAYQAHLDTDVILDVIWANGFEVPATAGDAGEWVGTGNTVLSASVTTPGSDNSEDYTNNSITVDYDNRATEPPAYFEAEIETTADGALYTALTWLKISESTTHTSADGWPEIIVRNALGGSTDDDWYTLATGRNRVPHLDKNARVSILVNWATMRFTVSIDGVPNGEHEIQASWFSGTRTLYLTAEVFATANGGASGGIATSKVTLYLDQDDWLYPPGLEVQGWGTYGSYTQAQTNDYTLVYHPQSAKVTFSGAQVSAQGLEDWSAPGGLSVSGTNNRTVTAGNDTDTTCFLPQARSFGHRLIEIECVSVNNFGNPEIGLGAFKAGDDVASRFEDLTASRANSALLADGGTLRSNGDTTTTGIAFATGDDIAFEVDPDGDQFWLWKNGAQNGPWPMTDFITDPAKGPFSAANFYASAAQTWSDQNTLVFAFRFYHSGDNSTQTIFNAGGLRLRLRMLASDLLSIAATDASSSIIAQYRTSALSVGWHSVLGQFDAKTPSGTLYVDDIDDTNAVTTIGGDIAYTSAPAGLGAGAASFQPFLGNIQLFGLCMGVQIDLSVEENRRRFFRADGYPSKLAGYDGRGAFGQIPDLWIVDGDAEANRGSRGPDFFAEQGSVPTTTALGDVHRPLVPIVRTASTGDQFRFRASQADFNQDYGSVRGWAEDATLPELLAAIEPGADAVNREQAFESMVQTELAPGLGEYLRDEQDAREFAQRMARSVGATVFWDESSVMQTFYLIEPASLSSSGTISISDLVEDTVFRRQEDRAERLSISAKSWPISAPHSDSEVAFRASRRDIIKERFGIESTRQPNLDPLYAPALTKAALETYLTDGEPLDPTEARAAELFLERILGLYTRKRWVLIGDLLQVPSSMDIGQRWDLDGTLDDGSIRWDLDSKPHLVIARPSVPGFSGQVYFWG